MDGLVGGTGPWTGDSAVYLKVSPTTSGAFHLFCKWHAGRWAKHYVYWYLPPGVPLELGLAELAVRYEQVLAGDRTPIKDSARPND